METKNNRYNQFMKEILGAFDLISKVDIYPYSHDDPLDAGFTYIHEESHRKLMSSTIFGEIQMIFAEISNHKPSERSLWFNEVERLLEETIANSWLTHEGFATFREITYGAILLPGKKPPPLPSNYQKAYQNYALVANSADNELKPFWFGLARAIAEAALNTTILREFPIEQIQPEKVLEHLAQKRNQPDFRIQQLTHLICENGFSHEFAEKFINEFRETLKETGYESVESIPEFMTLISKNPLPYEVFMREWDKKETILWENEIEHLKPDFEIIESNTASNEILKYHDDARVYLHKYDIDLMEKRVATSFNEASLQNEQVDYKTPNLFQEKLVPEQNVNSELSKLLEPDISYVVLELGKVPNRNMQDYIDGKYIYVAYVTPFIEVPPELVPNDQKYSGRKLYTPTMEQYAFFGDRELIWSIARKLRGKTRLVALDWFYVLSENWQSSQEVAILLKEFEAEPLIIVQSTDGQFLRDRIPEWQQQGIDEITVVKSDDKIVYFVFTFSSGLRAMIKVTKILLAILNAQKSEIIVWFNNLSLEFAGP